MRERVSSLERSVIRFFYRRRILRDFRFAGSRVLDIHKRPTPFSSSTCPSRHLTLQCARLDLTVPLAAARIVSIHRKLEVSSRRVGRSVMVTAYPEPTISVLGHAKHETWALA